jgi:hypothetical protein
MKNFLKRPRRVFKASYIMFPPYIPHKTLRNHFPNHCTPQATTCPPAGEQLPNQGRHNPTQPKLAKDSVPQGIRHSTMKKKMIHQLPILLAKPTSIDHYHTSPAKIVNGGDLTSSSYPSKKGHSRRSLGPPNAFPRKGEGPMRRKHLVV